jgi:hypothetical protein
MPKADRQPNATIERESESGARAAVRSQISAGELAIDAFKDYARERPEIVTMWAFGLGFVLGWKLRIW